MIAVVSDLHAMKPERLAQLDRDIGHFNPDEIWCLGDLVGYGTDPKETIDWVRDRCQVAVGGNHDAALAGLLPEFREGLPDWLKNTYNIAEKKLDQDYLAWLKKLPKKDERHGTRIFHGSGPDPWMGFVSSPGDLKSTLGNRLVALVGHTHCPGYWSLKGGGEINHQAAEHRESIDIANQPLILNPGSAGLKQTSHNCRARDLRPGWLLYQPEGFAVWRRFGPKV